MNMLENNHYEVVIVGGGIAGLTLANALEQGGISYVLWEAAPTIAPKNGAGIGIQPSGLRILDQLGIFKEVEGRTVRARTIVHRDENGCEIAANRTMDRLLEEYRIPLPLGYGPAFAERQMFLQILHGSLKNKMTVYTSKTVVSLQQSADRVTVTALDGSQVSGELVVGADGTHSRVREAIDNAVTPIGQKSRVQHSLSSRFSCVYGVSKPVPSLPEATLNFIHREQIVLLVITGKDHTIYWFVFNDMDRTFALNETPRFSERDADVICKMVANVKVTQDVVFGDIYATRTTAIMTPLVEGLSTNWHSNRMVLVGDSVHKTTPHSAMGGNLAMESAACIANLLVDIKRKSSDSTIPADALAAALESFSRMRLERSSQAVKLASMICRQQVAQGPGRDVYVADLIKTTQEEWLARGLGSMAGAAKLEYLASSTRVDKYSQRVLEFQREARENTESAGSKDEGPQHFGSVNNQSERAVVNVAAVVETRV